MHWLKMLVSNTDRTILKLGCVNEAQNHYMPLLMTCVLILDTKPAYKFHIVGLWSKLLSEPGRFENLKHFLCSHKDLRPHHM